MTITIPAGHVPTIGVTAECVTPQSRLHALFSPAGARPLPGSRWEPDGSGVLTGYGMLGGAYGVGFATDPRLKGGALGSDGCRRIVQAIEYARHARLPVVGLWHSGGARIGENVTALDGLGQLFAATVRASGRVPQISVVLGPAAGGAAYGPALTDVVVMSDAGRIFVTGPDVVRSVTGEDVGMEHLGGPEPHGRHSGVAHVVTADEGSAIDVARQIATLLSVTGWGAAGCAGTGDGPGCPAVGTVPAAALDRADLAAVLPERANRAYDVRPLIAKLLDGPGVELHATWAPNIVTTLGRLAGRTVGVIANNPLRLGGCLDARAADKAARFVRMCDSLGVPLAVVVDVPGYLPGTKQEWNGVVRRGAKLLHAFAEASVPRVTLVTRKAYGGAYIAMNSRSLGATAIFAWPSAEIAVMGAAAAVEILHRRRLAAEPSAAREALRARLIGEHQRVTGGAAQALAMGLIDEVISPAHTRSRLAQALLYARQARGAHTNIPL